MNFPGGDAFCIVDGKAQLIYSSHTLNSLLGFDKSEVQNKNLYSFIHPDDRDKITGLLTNGVAVKENYGCALRARTKEGEYIECKASGSYIGDTKGKKRQAIIHFRQSTDNRTNGKIETDSDNKFRTLFNNTYDAIFLMKDDIFIDCNPRTEVLFGCSREELLRKKPHDFSPVVQPDGRNSKEKALEKINKALRGIPQSFEWTHCRKDGVKFDAEVSLNRIDIDGEQMLQAIVRDITKRKETEAELRYRVDFEKFIASISTHFINLAPDEIDSGIRNTLEDVGVFAGIDRSFIFLLDEKANEYSILHEWCNDGVATLCGRRLTINSNAIPWWHGKLSRFENIRIADVAILPKSADGEKKFLQSIGSQSVLCAPLRIGKSLIGFFGFDTVTKKKHWSLESAALLRIVGEIIANSLERKHRDEELRRMADQRKHLLEVSTSMLSTLNLDEVIRQTLRVLNEIIRFDECGIHLLDQKNEVLQPHIIVDSWGDPIETNKSVIPLERGIVSSVIKSGAAEMVNDAHSDPRSYYPSGIRVKQEHMICVPMNTKNTVLGTFTVIRHNDSPFTTEEFELVQLFVGYATVAMENAQLYQAVQRQHSITSALLQTALSIVEQKDVEKVMALIAEQSLRITRVNRCAVFLWNDVQEQLEPIVVITPHQEQMPLFEKMAIKPGDAAIIGEILKHRNPVIVDGARIHELLPPQLVKKFNIRSMLVIPFFKGGKLLGGMTLDDTHEERSFTSEDMASAIGIANQAAVAIENARLFEQIKASEERYRSLFEDSKDGVFTSTEEGRIIDINPAGIEMLGYDTKEELQNLNVATEIYDNPRRREEYKNALRMNGYVKDFEAVLKRKDNRTISCLITSTAFRDETTGRVYYRGFIRDVTDKKMLEDKLRQTQKMESLGQLAGGIAHDFNNVLGIVQASLSALKVKLDNSNNGLYQYVEMGENAVMRGADVARRLLTFSQSNEVRRVPLLINDVIGDLTNVLRHTIEKNITIETKISTEVPPVLGDHGQLYQMLLNLCVNARDALIENTNGINNDTICISVDQVDAKRVPGMKVNESDDRYLRIKVSDNGDGMPEHIKNKIFEPFFTTKSTGTGLGLSVVYGIVQGHNGIVDVESESGKGTTFFIYLPIVEAIRADVVEEDTEEIIGGDETILIVEDEVVLCRLLEEVLTSKGYSVLKAADGNEALKLYGRQHDDIDAVIMDMGLPKLPGQTLFLKIKHINPSARIILASGYLDEDLKQDLFELGAAAFIQKPYKAQEILKTARKVLNNNKIEKDGV